MGYYAKPLGQLDHVSLAYIFWESQQDPQSPKENLQLQSPAFCLYHQYYTGAFMWKIPVLQARSLKAFMML